MTNKTEVEDGLRPMTEGEKELARGLDEYFAHTEVERVLQIFNGLYTKKGEWGYNVSPEIIEDYFRQALTKAKEERDKEILREYEVMSGEQPSRSYDDIIRAILTPKE